MRRVVYSVALFLVVLLSLVPAALSIEMYKQDRATPETLQKRYERLHMRAALIHEDYQRAYNNENLVFTEQKWGELAIRFEHAVMNLEAGKTGKNLCELFSQGSYCDDAAKDLNESEAELLVLEKESLKFSENQSIPNENKS